MESSFDPRNVVWLDRLGDWWRDVRVAGAFLTRLPFRLTDDDLAVGTGALATAYRAFPLIGALIGLMGGAVYGLAWVLGVPPLVAAFLAVGATVLATGGLHEDAIADVADGMGGGFGRDRILEIMRDSTVGTYGALAIGFSVGLRVAVLAALADPVAVLLACVGVASFSRAVAPVAAYKMAPARADGLGAGAGTPLSAVAITAAALGVVLALLFAGPVGGVVAILLGGACAVLMAGLAERKIGGYTGDVLGAMIQVAEVAALVAIVAVR